MFFQVAGRDGRVQRHVGRRALRKELQAPVPGGDGASGGDGDGRTEGVLTQMENSLGEYPNDN